MVNSKDLDSVRKYLNEHKKEIMNEYDAEGVAIGKMDLKDEAYVIVVYLADRESLPEQRVIMDGISFKFEVTGKFALHT